MSQRSPAPRMQRREASPTTCRFWRRCWRCRRHLARLLLRFFWDFCRKHLSQEISNPNIICPGFFLPVAYIGTLQPLNRTWIPSCSLDNSFSMVKLRPPAHHEWTIDLSLPFNQFSVPATNVEPQKFWGPFGLASFQAVCQSSGIYEPTTCLKFVRLILITWNQELISEVFSTWLPVHQQTSHCSSGGSNGRSLDGGTSDKSSVACEQVKKIGALRKDSLFQTWKCMKMCCCCCCCCSRCRCLFAGILVQIKGKDTSPPKKRISIFATKSLSWQSHRFFWATFDWRSSEQASTRKKICPVNGVHAFTAPWNTENIWKWSTWKAQMNTLFVVQGRWKPSEHLPLRTCGQRPHLRPTRFAHLHHLLFNSWITLGNTWLLLSYYHDYHVVIIIFILLRPL